MSETFKKVIAVHCLQVFLCTPESFVGGLLRGIGSEKPVFLLNVGLPKETMQNVHKPSLATENMQRKQRSQTSQ